MDRTAPGEGAAAPFGDASSTARRGGSDPHPPTPSHLTPQERAVLDVLWRCRGRVVSRYELSRHAGLSELSERRCDALIVGLRRAIGADRITTVRRRGWMLRP